MRHTATWILLGGIAAGTWTGCGEAPAAQEPGGAWEHALLEHVHFYGDEERDEHRFLTAGSVVEGASMGTFWAALGVAGSPRNTPSDGLRVLDHLTARGWALFDRSDVAFVTAAGVAVAERFLFRRRT